MTGEEIRKFYTSLDVSQVRMASMLGVSTVSFKRYVMGERPVPAYIARFVLLLEMVSKQGLINQYLALVEAEPAGKRARRLMTPEQLAARVEKASATVKASGARLGRPRLVRPDDGLDKK